MTIHLSNRSQQADVIVVGAGVIGMATAWRLAQRHLSVIVVDPTPGGGASHAAAGMLAPVTELHYGEEPLLALNLESARRYPSFVSELEAASGHSVGYRTCGTLAVAADADDLAWLDELHHHQRSLGLEVERMTSRECRTHEPALSPGVRGGFFVAGDHQVDPRRLVPALEVAATSSGAVIRSDRVVDVSITGGAVTGVTLEGGTTLSGKTVVMAAGAWTGAIGGLAATAAPPVRPVKGQIARLRPRPGREPMAAKLLSGNVRGLVQSRSLYFVPRIDGELVVGATVEEQGFDTAVTAGGILDLLNDAYALVPGVYELELAEVMAGLRPGTPDNAPVIGSDSIPGLVWATGHYRNGVLLAPLTADAVADLVTNADPPECTLAFGPDRFGVSAGREGVAPGAAGRRVRAS